MHQTILARQDRDKGTEVNNASDFTRVDLTHLGLSSNSLNHLDGSVSRGRVLTKDLHGAVIIDVYRSAGFFRDLANRRTTLTDDVANLVLIYLQRGHAGRILRGNLTRRIQHRVHLPKNVQACFQSLLEGTLHDLFVDPFDLDVHLQRGHTFGSTRHLEVHIAEVILVAKNVGQHRKLVAFLYQTHGNTSHRGRQGYTRGHHGERTHTDRCHRAGTVGFRDFRHHTNRVGEFLFTGQYCRQAATRESAVTDLSSAGKADASRLTYRVGREVVVEHERIPALAFQGVNDLRIPG